MKRSLKRLVAAVTLVVMLAFGAAITVQLTQQSRAVLAADPSSGGGTGGG
jgi:hypothetical protein